MEWEEILTEIIQLKWTVRILTKWQLNVFRIIGQDLARRISKTMNPRYNLYIDRINGRVNKDLMPLKDEVVGFWLFNNC